MFATFLDYLSDVFGRFDDHMSLESYIVENDPQSPDDVDRLEREYNARYRNVNQFERYY